MTNELDDLAVYGDTQVGWCARTPVNETLDEDGHPLEEKRGFGVADPRAPSRRLYDDPEVQALRNHLKASNGIKGLDICAPDEIDRAVRLFFRDGFVVVKDLLDTDALARWRGGCARELRKILEPDGHDGRKYITETMRLPHRYSYGTASASRQLLHDPVWASMIDLPATTPILKAIFGSDDYLVLGAGGDLCLPGAVEYQHLHGDVREQYHLPEARIRQAAGLGVDISAAEHEGALDPDRLDGRTKQRIVERTPPVVTINFTMSDLTWENGPIRQIPGTQGVAEDPPTPADEPEWMRLCALVGAPAGAGVFRDNRAWHSATPNLSREIRALPNVEYGAPWLDANRPHARTMPHEIWQTLSPHAQHLSRRVKADPGVWPAGAGVMHALANKRKEANGTLARKPGEGSQRR